MKVNLISYSQLPKEEVFGNTWMSDATLQDLVAYCVRESYKMWQQESGRTAPLVSEAELNNIEAWKLDPGGVCNGV